MNRGAAEDRLGPGIAGKAQGVAQRLEDDGTYPNNPRLSLLLYRGVLNLPAQGAAAAIEALFRANDWGGAWRNGIYGCHHYHSTAHEVLGESRSTVEGQLGGGAGTQGVAARHAQQHEQQ